MLFRWCGCIVFIAFAVLWLLYMVRPCGLTAVESIASRQAYLHQVLCLWCVSRHTVFDLVTPITLFIPVRGGSNLMHVFVGCMCQVEKCWGECAAVSLQLKFQLHGCLPGCVLIKICSTEKLTVSQASYVCVLSNSFWLCRPSVCKARLLVHANC